MDEINPNNKDKKSQDPNMPAKKKLILKGHYKRVRSLALDTTNKIDNTKVKEEFLVSCSDDGTVRVW